MRGAVMAAVLMDREDALHPTGRSAERLVHGVSKDPLRQASIHAGESLGRAVIDGQDEAEIDGVAETAGVLHEGTAHRLLIPTERTVSLPDSEQLAPFSSLQALLAVRDVADLFAGSLGVVVIARLDEEHFSSPLQFQA
jgi:hypothetical protein